MWAVNVASPVATHVSSAAPLLARWPVAVALPACDIADRCVTRRVLRPASDSSRLATELVPEVWRAVQVHSAARPFSPDDKHFPSKLTWIGSEANKAQRR